MISIKVDTSGILQLKSKLKDISDKQVAFATSQALNAAAYSAMQTTTKEMGRVFDRPTPWVMRSVRYVKSKKTDLRASVDFDFWGNKTGVTVGQVLKAEIFGGQRRLKRHEIALHKVGILPPGMAIVPGSAAQMDQYGNIKPSQIVQIMSWFKSFGEQGYHSNLRDGGKRLGKDNKRTGAKGFAYFALRKQHGKLPPGIYQRFIFGLGSSVKPVMIFVTLPSYRKRLDFYTIAEKAARKEFDDKFPAFLDNAIRTAK